MVVHHLRFHFPQCKLVFSCDRTSFFGGNIFHRSVDFVTNSCGESWDHPVKSSEFYMKD